MKFATYLKQVNTRKTLDMFLIFLSLRLFVCLDVDVADPICLTFLPHFPANDILLSWETVPMMFACVFESSMTGDVISIAHLLDIFPVSQGT